MTAVIVTDRGDYYLGTISLVTGEDVFSRRSIPLFGKPRKVTYTEDDLIPLGHKAGDTVVFNQPRVYDNERQALRAMVALKKRFWPLCPIAVVS